MNIGDCLSQAHRRLREADPQDGRRDARVLLAHVLNATAETVFAHPEQAVGDDDAGRFSELIERRCRREPLSRIIGRREFWSLWFDLSPATLDPRPDSEAIIEAAIELRPERARALRLLDLGTGTGCLTAALLSEYPNADALATDLSPEAVATASGNLERLGFAPRATCRQADWDAGVAGEFDLIVSNPPYIVEGDIDGLAAAVADYDPRLALSGGADGLDAYRALAPVLLRRLAGDGLAIIEHGEGQHSDAVELFGRAGLARVAGRADLAGRQRCLVVRKS
jgi:release factor glutamine methyltransferase